MSELHCVLVCDTPAGVLEAPLLLPAGASVADALALAQQRWPDAQLDWSVARCGIWGRVCARAAIPAEGDRIEIYRELPADPRVRRRLRVQERRRSAR
ncbi:MAG: RnfH family protein [Steroidobacteraceae bacterium]